MVFTPLADWKVRLLSIGMLVRRSKRFVGVDVELLRGEVIG